MKNLFFTFLFMCASVLFGQSDTIIVSDYTKVMVSINVDNGNITPITNLKGLTQAGFFLSDIPNGKIRICNDEIVYIWVNGKLLQSIKGCSFLEPESLTQNAKPDTVFISFTTESEFSNFQCELIKFEELQVIKEDISLTRPTRNPLTEFVIVSILIILIFLGFLIGYHPARVSFIVEKTFTFKVNTYEFINTNFINASSLLVSCVLSLTLGFLGVYLNELLALSLLDRSLNSTEFILAWLQFSFSIFVILFLKWILIEILSSLFNFKGLKSYQLFDFVNFNIFFFIPLATVVLLDFIFFTTADSLLSLNFLWIFPLVLILFQAWFTLKLVNHSPHRKLIIISYLCATEIMPAVFLLSWFLK